MAEEFDITTYCESGNATAGLCEVNDDLQSVKVGVNSFFLIFAVRSHAGLKTVITTTIVDLFRPGMNIINILVHHTSFIVV